MDEPRPMLLPKWFWPLVVTGLGVPLILLLILVLKPDEVAHEAAHVTPKQAPAEPEPPTPEAFRKELVTSCKIIKEEDISMKTLEGRLSSYSHQELDALPINVRKSYRVVVPWDISKEQFKSTLVSIVLKKTKQNPDIDEIVIFAYDREEFASGPYTMGKLEWCPNGDWGGMTARIASTNDRSSYKYVFDIKAKVGAASPSRSPLRATNTPERSPLVRSGNIGLLGTPLPVGAVLTESTSGDPLGLGRPSDPREVYKIDASAAEITAFFLREMPKDGWQIGSDSNCYFGKGFLFFDRGTLMLGVILISNGTFTLTGS